jgi:hypothetical protein
MKDTEREFSWGVTGATLAVLHQITSMGYVVSVHRLPSSLLGSEDGSVEMHAVELGANPPNQFIARVRLSEPGDIEYRCAQILAEHVGIWFL